MGVSLVWGKFALIASNLPLMTKASPSFKAFFPNARMAFPLSAPGPHMVLEDVLDDAVVPVPEDVRVVVEDEARDEYEFLFAPELSRVAGRCLPMPGMPRAIE